MYDSDELERNIDIAFQNTICEPRRTEIENFFENIIKCSKGFQLLKEGINLEVIDIFYYGNEPLGYIFALPCLEYYDDELQLDLPTLKLDAYNYFDVDSLVKQVILDSGISLPQSELYDFESEKYWENQHELEMEFLIDCWRNVKLKVDSDVYAFLHASDSSGYVYDLDLGSKINGRSASPISEYLSNRGVHLNAMLTDREEKEEEVSTFWSRLFGRKRNK